MKVLHVVPHVAPEQGGAVSAALGMAEALAEAGVRVRLAATDHGLAQAPPAAFELELFPCRFCAWRYAPGMGRWLRREVPWADIVHIHTMWTYPTQAAARASRRAGVPYVLRPAGMLERWSMSRSALRKRLYAAAVEGGTIRHARALHWTADEERERSAPWSAAAPALVMAHGVPRRAYESLPSPELFRRRVPALGHVRFLLHLGRVHAKKQPEVSIRALAQLRADFPDLALVVAGPGERAYLDSLRALARDLGLEAAVHFTGMLEGDAVQEALVAATAFVLPSLQENFGLAVAEAMAAGCPVVVSPEVALASQLAAHGAGWVAAATPAAVAEALRELLADEPARLARAARARALVLDRFTWPAVARQLVAAYEGLLQSPRAGAA
jgi:glycosyltransferase involved in cell wall biosynthesis